MIASGERDSVLRSAQALMTRRTNVMREYQERTGQILQSEKEAARWSAILAKKQAKLVDQTANPKQLKPRKPTFRTLLVFRIQDERDRFLNSF